MARRRQPRNVFQDFFDEYEEDPIEMLTRAIVNTPQAQDILDRVQAGFDYLAGAVDPAVRTARKRAQAQRPHAPPPRSPRPAPAKSPDPMIEARSILNFGSDEKLTADLVRKRKKILAGLFHPDRPGGSKEAMQRINSAADRLIRSLVR